MHIHRDYVVLGSEIHIDMFDDQVEITSRAVCLAAAQFKYDIYGIRSMRRNHCDC